MNRIENWRTGGAEPQTLQSGRHALSREEVLASQRGRIMRAALDELGEFGAGGMTVGGLVERAKVSKKTFYENFTGLDECVAESLETVNLLVGAEIADAAAAADPNVRFSRVGALVSELAAAAAEEPIVATAILAAGFGLNEPKAASWNFFNTARQRIINAYYEADREALPDLPEASELKLVAAVGLMEQWLMRGLSSGTQEDLPAQAAEVTSQMVAILSGGKYS